MIKYFIKDDVKLSAYGFIKREDGWYRKYVNGMSTFIDEDTKEIWLVDEPMRFRGLTYRIEDLMNDNLVRKEAI